MSRSSYKSLGFLKIGGNEPDFLRQFKLKIAKMNGYNIVIHPKKKK